MNQLSAKWLLLAALIAAFLVGSRVAQSPVSQHRTSSLAGKQQVYKYFSTNGSQIVDQNGRSVRIAAVNWLRVN